MTYDSISGDEHQQLNTSYIQIFCHEYISKYIKVPGWKLISLSDPLDLWNHFEVSTRSSPQPSSCSYPLCWALSSLGHGCLEDITQLSWSKPCNEIGMIHGWSLNYLELMGVIACIKQHAYTHIKILLLLSIYIYIFIHMNDNEPVKTENIMTSCSCRSAAWKCCSSLLMAHVDDQHRQGHGERAVLLRYKLLVVPCQTPWDFSSAKVLDLSYLSQEQKSFRISKNSLMSGGNSRIFKGWRPDS